MFLLDKVDLFSVKAEKRHLRIEEIFEERIRDINEASKTYDMAAIEVMREQKLRFSIIRESIFKGVNTNNMDLVNSGFLDMASFLQIDLPYRNQDEFVAKFDDLEISL